MWRDGDNDEGDDGDDDDDDVFSRDVVNDASTEEEDMTAPARRHRNDIN
jgi:hypothetical protein